jgi:hypothetical protein
MGCTLDIGLKPRAKRNAVIGITDTKIVCAVTAPPIEGRANKALIALLSKTLKIPKSSISLIKGAHSKHKAVAIESLSRDDVLKKITLISG